MEKYPNLMEALGKVVETLRKERKMTKTNLASFSGIQERYIRSITKGLGNPTICAIFRICDALGVSPIDFISKILDELSQEKK